MLMNNVMISGELYFQFKSRPPVIDRLTLIAFMSCCDTEHGISGLASARIQIFQTPWFDFYFFIIRRESRKPFIHYSPFENGPKSFQLGHQKQRFKLTHPIQLMYHTIMNIIDHNNCTNVTHII